ncbi:MAG: glycosyltransferase family 8 protein [Prevotellaceae bacterium]|nr:glycosyltransferase family 8 protein [Prevotellaceae bacterium]
MNEVSSLVPVVVAFTPDYFVPAATCLHSIMKHAGEDARFHVICLLSEDLPEHLREKIQLIGGENTTYSFFNMFGRLQNIYVDSKYTEAASYRLLLPDLLPEYEKVIYIDCDVIVRNDLAALYHSVNLRDYYMAAVFEAPLDFQIERFEAIGCNPMEYFNSGFLVMNLEKMRHDGLVEKFLEASRIEGLEFPDQDVLNMVCKGHILGLPPYYNSIRTFYLPQYKQSFLRKYTETELSDVKKHGTVHYTGAKPWNHFTIEFVLWWTYYDELPKAIKEEWKMNRKLHLLYLLCKMKYSGCMIFGLQKIYRYLRYK